LITRRGDSSLALGMIWSVGGDIGIRGDSLRRIASDSLQQINFHSEWSFDLSVRNEESQQLERNLEN